MPHEKAVWQVFSVQTSKPLRVSKVHHTPMDLFSGETNMIILQSARCFENPISSPCQPTSTRLAFPAFISQLASASNLAQLHMNPFRQAIWLSVYVFLHLLVWLVVIMYRLSKK